MKENSTKTTLVIAVVAAFLVVAGVALYRQGRRTSKGYQGQSSGSSEGVGGWWSGLWDNAANIVDAGGRHTSSFVTSLTNGVSSIIATKNNTGAVFSEYGYSDERTDYGPWMFAGALLIAAGLVYISSK